MQKKTIKASILIWAIFISLIITATFIQISTKINKNLRNNNSLSKNLEANNIIKNVINSGSLIGNYTNQTLENGDEIQFTGINNITKSLKKSENFLSKIILNNNITITVNEGGPVNYSNNGNTGIITNNSTFSATIGDLLINNLGGYTKIEITSDTDNSILSEYTNYKVITKIGNKEITKTKGKIKNF